MRGRTVTEAAAVLRHRVGGGQSWRLPQDLPGAYNTQCHRERARAVVCVGSAPRAPRRIVLSAQMFPRGGPKAPAYPATEGAGLDYYYYHFVLGAHNSGPVRRGTRAAFGSTTNTSPRRGRPCAQEWASITSRPSKPVRDTVANRTYILYSIVFVRQPRGARRWTNRQLMGRDRMECVRRQLLHTDV